MGTVRVWWNRLIGRADAPPAKPKSQPARTKQADEGLTLADGPPEKKPSRTGAAGFDPYSSDAGYAKPHSWERVDHD